MNKLLLYILLVLSIEGCSSDSVKNENKIAYPVSYDFFRFNFLDKEHCKNCIQSSTFKSVSLKTIVNTDNRVISNLNNEKVREIYFLLNQNSKIKAFKRPINNELVLKFYFKNGNVKTYSYISDRNWLVDDSLLIKTDLDVLKCLRSFNNLDDLTDYRYVTKGIVPGDDNAPNE